MEEAVRELRDRLGGLPTPAEAEDIWAEIWHQEAHNSTAIEGNTLVLQEVEKTVDPHPHATDLEGPGNFRRHEIARFPGGMKPPSWPEVDARIRSWLDRVAELQAKTDTPLAERLAVLHNDFEAIHPFLDGNGRTGRLVLSLLLGRLGYPPAIIYKRDRDAYLRAMRRADVGDPGLLGELIARSVTANLYRFVMPAVAGPVKLLPLPALATADLTENALRVAAMRGRLRAVKADDGTWRSSQKWVNDYTKSRYRRGRPA
ncbi:Fic family protein [Micromonospora sp. DT227]|uniref:Fic family protein n=2 Tax=unclassified Micromonospora TaxID=2617518 RepID=UPI003CF3B081